MKMKIDHEAITDDLLKDLIEKCEDKMSSPFQEKAKAKMAAIEVPEEEEQAEGEDHDSEESPLDDMSKEDLIKLYEKMKDKE
jgi:hypothetical protein